MNVSDLLELLAQWGFEDECDIDNDGVVSITDFLALLAAWGDCP